MSIQQQQMLDSSAATDYRGMFTRIDEIPNLAAGSVRNPSDFKTQLLELALFVFLRKKKPLEGTTQGLVVHTPRKKLFVIGGRIKGLTFVVCSLRWHLLAATRIQLLCS